ncbi:phage tail spike protein [Ornithinibacillus sp. 4-3]|uniref:Phage tail spike protein n=1 Tax=Ornithinibacillus sp. 4-3 TaxID=3231488 RepID=A0AB39HHF3_9BACI
MLPILYKANETNFTHNGIGLLRDAITAVATEELNGMFELQMEYDSKGEYAHVIDEEMIIKARANDKQDPQLFRIYSIEKNHDNDNLIIDAQHITYDFANNFVEKLEARNITKKQVMELIGASTAYSHPFNVTSSNNTTRSTTNLYRTNPLQMVGGMDGSVLQIWGGQLERDNFHLIMHDRRGRDDGVKIQYAKNLTGLTAKVDISNVVTRIYPFAYNDEDDRLITITGKYVDSDHINDYDIIRVMPVDYSQEEEIDWEQTDAQIRSKLTQLASRYFIETGNDKPKTEIDVEFEHLWETKEYKDLDVLELVGMGDTVHIHHSKLNVTARAIVNRIEYDVLADVNIRVGIGNVKSRLSDNMNRIDRVEEKVDQAESNANQAIISANGKNKNYYGPDMPTNNLNEGDTWFQLIDGQYTRTWRYDGIQWQLIIDMDVNDAYEQSQEAKADAQQAVDRANQATEDANQAISNAQSAFDQAQSAINQSTSAFNLANQAFEDVAALSTMVDTNSGEISTIKQSVQGLQISVSDAAGNASNALQIATGLQNTVSNVEGQVSTLQQTATNISSRIDNLQVGGRNILGNSKKPELRTNNSTTSPLNRTEYEDYWRYEPQNNSGLSTYSQLNDSNYPIYDKSWLGRDMAVSITVRVSKDVKLRFRFSDWGVAGTRIKEDYFDVKASDGWTMLKMPVPKNLITRNPDTEFIRFLLYTADNGDTTITPYDGHIDVKDWFIGFGTKVSDWSPAPEDTDSKFSSITQTIDGIQLKVSNAEGNINTVTTLANTNQAKIQDAEGNINTLTQTATSLESTIGRLESSVGNLVKNPDLTGGVEGWTRSSASTMTLSHGIVQFDGASTRQLSFADSNSNGQLYSDWFRVDPSKAYEISMWVRKGSNDGRFYIGVHTSLNDNNPTNNINIKSWDLDGEFINDTNNFYFWASNSPEDRAPTSFTKVVGYIMPAGTLAVNMVGLGEGGVRTSAAGKRNGSFLSGTKWMRIRILNRENSNSANTLRIIHPKVVEVYDHAVSQITQLSDNINLRVEKDDIINQINISTESILISGRKVHITGQTTIDNASIDGAKIKNASIGTAQIGAIDAAKITTGTLNANNVLIRGGNATDYTLIDGSFLESRGRYTNTWFGVTKTHDVVFRLNNGYLQAHNLSEGKRLNFSDTGISTYIGGSNEDDDGVAGSGVIEFFSHMYDSNVRGLTLYSNRGNIGIKTAFRDIYLDADRDVNIIGNRGVINFRPAKDVRAGNNDFQFYVHNNPSSSDTDGLIRFGSQNLGFATGIRFKKTTTGVPTVWITDGAGAKGTGHLAVGSLELMGGGILDAYNIRSNRIRTLTTDAFLYLGTDEGVRITSRGTNDNNPIIYRPLYASNLITYNDLEVGNNGRIANDDGKRTYIQGNTDVSATRYKSGTLVTMRASEFSSGSLAEYKADIREWNVDILDIYRNEITIYDYVLKSDLEDGSYRRRQGLVIGDGYNTPLGLINNDGIQQYQMNSWNAKVSQALIKVTDNHEDRINILELENQYLKQKIKLLEEAI